MKWRIDVVIPTLNRVHMTRRCLQSLSEQTRQPDSITIVDSGSSDGTREMLADEYPDVKLIEAGLDVWWTGAVKLGIESVVSKDVEQDKMSTILLLNDDLIFESDFIEIYERSVGDRDRALFGALVLDEHNPERITHGGCRINWWTAKWGQYNQQELIDNIPPNSEVEVDALTGRGVWIPQSVFADIGNYNDEALPQHGDYEFTIRASNAGYRLFTLNDVKVWCNFDRESDLNLKPLRTLSEIRDAFTHLRSYANIAERLKFAKATSKGTLQRLSFTTFDLLRVVFSVIRRVRLGKVS